MRIVDPISRLPIWHDDRSNLDDVRIDHPRVIEASERLVLSPSGWRKVFAISGLIEGREPSVSDEDKILILHMARAFGSFLRRTAPSSSIKMAVGIDTRFTGPAIADIFIQAYLAMQIDLRYLFITPSPEIMAFVGNTDTNAFTYVSASHNPLGYNGVKFGLNDGGILSSADSRLVIDSFWESLEKGDHESLLASCTSVDKGALMKVYQDCLRWKKNALEAYEAFALRVTTNLEEIKSSNPVYLNLQKRAKKSPLGIVAELNGSARTLSIDGKLLADLGISFHPVNDAPRQFRHEIVPEGDSLSQCRESLDAVRKQDPSFLFGYVPDCDGDRGNIVCFSTSSGSIRTLHAQEVFALICAAEMAYMAYLNSCILAHSESLKHAIVANGPTSLRIDRIAAMFGAEVVRCEVGEANAVNLAREMRSKGYLVRVLGEGSTGGNITHPAAVRDPLHTILTMAKLLLFPEVSEILFDKLETSCTGSENISHEKVLDLVLHCLPKYTTTGAYEERAIMHIHATDHAKLKGAYESIFVRDWEEKKSELSGKFDIVDWEEHNYEGTRCILGSGSGSRSGDQSGGLKIVFKNSKGVECAFIWMRGSGTEPVFRIMADLEGSDLKGVSWLIEWQREMVLKADKVALKC